MPTKSLSKLIAQPTKRTLAVALGLFLMGSSVCSSALAQAWPTKPVKVVVNFPPGGAADQIARAIGIPLAEALGQPVVIENKGGANGKFRG
jgi:tripartite-type tricarboxylate transporter receptor subunit TctC